MAGGQALSPADRGPIFDTMEKALMVGVAQLVERWIVVPVAEGSNPSTHPIFNNLQATLNLAWRAFARQECADSLLGCYCAPVPA